MTKLTGKQTSFTEYYTDHNNKKTFNNGLESARAAGYKGTDKVLIVTACQNIVKPMIKAYISKIRAENKVKAEFDTQIAIQDLDNVIVNLRVSAESGNISANRAIIAAISEKASVSGLHVQTIHTEQLPEQRKLSEKEEETAKAFAEWSLSRGKYPRKVQEAG